MVRCDQCSLVFLNPMYSDQELAALYTNDYYAYQNHFHKSRWKEVLKTFVLYRTGTRDPRFSAPGRMLDLGCGSGWAMREMRDRGWETYGVEINRAAAALGSDTMGLNIFAGTLKDARFPSEYFDYVRANHSFEHIASPSETLDEIVRILRPNGKMLIGVPNVSGLNARIFGRYWWYLGAPVHPFSYSEETLAKFLRKHHLSVDQITYNSDYSGILGSVQIWLNRNTTRKSNEGMAINSGPLRLGFQWAAKVLDLCHLGDAIEVVASKSAS